MAKWLHKRVEEDGFEPELKLIDDDPTCSAYPALVEHLTLTTWEDGSSREPSSVIVFVEAGRWKACLNDKACGRCGWVSAENFLGLWEALERGLQGGAIDWRRSRDRPGLKRAK